MKNLGLLMTAGNSLENWFKTGSYEREIRLYRQLSQQSISITIFDYSSEKSWMNASEHLKSDIAASGIKVVPLYGSYNGKSRLFRVLISIFTVCKNNFNLTHVKSNQSKGAWLGIFLKVKDKKLKFLHRSGYCWSDFTLRLTGSWFKYSLTRFIEILVNVLADQIHVASELDTKSFLNFERKKVKLVPNWVEISSGSLSHEKFNRSIFIGRLEEQKGICSLIEIWPENESLVIVGDGKLKKKVEERIESRKLNVEIIPSLPHTKLMSLLSSCKCLVNWSDFEGNPKVILEAIFCNVPVLARNVDGVREILSKGEFGDFVETESELKTKLQELDTKVLDKKEVKRILYQSKFEHTLTMNLGFLEYVDSSNCHNASI